MYRCRECKTEYREKVEYCDCGNNTFDYVEDKKSAVCENQKRSMSLEKKAEIVSSIFFVFCIILSILVWMIPVGGNSAQKKKSPAQVKQKPIVTKAIPDIDKIWDDTPHYNPPEQQPEQQKIIPADYIKNTSQSNNKNSAKKTKEQLQKKNNNMSVNPEILIPPSPKKPAYNPNSPDMLRYKNNLRAALFSKFAVGSIQGSGECSIEFSVDKSGKLINRKFSKESSNKGLNDTVYYMLMSVPRFSPPPHEYNGEKIRMNFKINNGDYAITIH